MRKERSRNSNRIHINKAAKLLITLAALLLISLTTENPLTTFLGFFDEGPNINGAYTAE